MWWWLRFAWKHRVVTAVMAALALAAAAAVHARLLDPARLRRTVERARFALLRSRARGGGGAAAGAGSGEERCRAFLLRTTGLAFEKVRPDWLRNPETGQRLELDMFHASDAVPHPIAFEFDGAQHDRYVPFYHGTIREFEAARRRDRAKDELCRARGVELIRIPADVHDNAEAFVHRHLARLGLVRAPAPLRP